MNLFKMAVNLKLLCVVLLSLFQYVTNSDLLCEATFCRNYHFETGCSSPAPDCSINNATHSGMWMPSPTPCNCCQFCLPFYGKEAHCSRGGPGLGTAVGRCGHGLTCVADSTDGLSYCRRMESVCHSAQDDYDARHERGEVGALESRPVCDGKGRYAAVNCVPTQTCFCQSEEGERLFGEMLNLGATTAMRMHCGCSRLHAKIQQQISPGVPHPVIGPRCTSDGNFNPVQCINRTCHCVNRITGAVEGNSSINLDLRNVTRLPCYDKDLDLFPSQNLGSHPYNYTTPCYERMKRMIEYLEQSEEDGYIVDLFSSANDCLPDGTLERISRTRNGTRICVDETGSQVGDFETLPNTQQYQDMDCKCAHTTHLMTSSAEQPVCCKNGNFRTIQCRRGLCRCVDSDGRQYGREAADATSLPCYRENWRDLGSTDCYSK